MAVNARGTQHLAEACQVRGIPLIHVSTDYVFGQAPVALCLPTCPVQKECTPSPSKAKKRFSHRAYAVADPCFGVVRRAGREFFANDARLAEAHGSLSVVNDQHGASVWRRPSPCGVAKLAKTCLKHLHHRIKATPRGMALQVPSWRWRGRCPCCQGHVGLSHRVSSTGLERVGRRPLEGADGVALRDMARGVGGPLVVQKRCLNLWSHEDQELLVQVKQKAQAWTQAPHDEETRQTVTRWLEGCDEDPALREAPIDAFYTELSFGTGGLRGKMGLKRTASTRRPSVWPRRDSPTTCWRFTARIRQASHGGSPCVTAATKARNLPKSRQKCRRGTC